MIDLLLNNLKTLIWIVTGIYAVVSIGFGIKHAWDDCILFGGYAVANLGALKLVSSYFH